MSQESKKAAFNESSLLPLTMTLLMAFFYKGLLLLYHYQMRKSAGLQIVSFTNLCSKILFDW